MYVSSVELRLAPWDEVELATTEAGQELLDLIRRYEFPQKDVVNDHGVSVVVFTDPDVPHEKQAFIQPFPYDYLSLVGNAMNAGLWVMISTRYRGVQGGPTSLVYSPDGWWVNSHVDINHQAVLDVDSIMDLLESDRYGSMFRGSMLRGFIERVGREFIDRSGRSLGEWYLAEGRPRWEAARLARWAKENENKARENKAKRNR